MMLYLILVLSALYFLYIFWIGIILKGWITLPPFRTQREPVFLCLSVVVPVRNEENSLPALLEALLVQDYPRDCFEIVLVDDHSTDSTAKVIKRYSSNNLNISYIKLPVEKSGKKRAIFEGVIHPNISL